MAEDEGTMPTGEAAPSQMSATDILAAEMVPGAGDAEKCCASCGKTGEGLKRCTACKSVWYCGVTCQIDHRKAHKKECKRIKKELEMWKPPPPTEECPVCLVPLPLQNSKATYWPCCGQTVCNACKAETDRALNITNIERYAKKLPPMESSCAFCRVSNHKRDSELIKRMEGRVAKGDLKAMVSLAGMYRDGEHGLARDETKTLELYHRAAALDCPNALLWLGTCFLEGELGLIQDLEKATSYFEDSAKKGNVISRLNLGDLKQLEEHHELAMKHFKLAAAAGHEDAVKQLWKYFSLKKLSKAELEEILRAHKEACDEMNSEERERYVAWREALEGNDGTLKNIYVHYYDGILTAKELNKALKVYQGGDVDQVNVILLKSRQRAGVDGMVRMPLSTEVPPV